MALILAGIDEAGYGPLLGPLCVGLVALRVEGWAAGEAPPDLWKLLRTGVCRKPGDKRRRIAFDDSKKLKLPNSITEESDGERHPLMHLERGTLALLAAASQRPATDLGLFEAIGADREPHPWYQGEPRPIPLSFTADQAAITANTLARSLSAAGVSVIGVRCRTVCECSFNEIVHREGSKAAATALGVHEHLRWIWSTCAADPTLAEGGPRVVCDRLGGRTDYQPFLAQAIPGATITTIEHSPRLSAYRLTDPGGTGVPPALANAPDAPRPRQMTVHFLPESETRHLPVAAASMLAKLTRELMMARFNAYWSGLRPELKPTAGYRQDGWRWLNEATQSGLVTPDVRALLVRTV